MIITPPVSPKSARILNEAVLAAILERKTSTSSASSLSESPAESLERKTSTSAASSLSVSPSESPATDTSSQNSGSPIKRLRNRQSGIPNKLNDLFSPKQFEDTGFFSAGEADFAKNFHAKKA